MHNIIKCGNESNCTFQFSTVLFAFQWKPLLMLKYSSGTLGNGGQKYMCKYSTVLQQWLFLPWECNTLLEADSQVCCFCAGFVPIQHSKMLSTATLQNRLQKTEICVIHIKYFSYLFLIQYLRDQREGNCSTLPLDSRLVGDPAFQNKISVKRTSKTVSSYPLFQHQKCKNKLLKYVINIY